MEKVEILSLSPMEGVYVLLGTNLGNRKDNLNQAQELIAYAGISIIKQSSIYETAAWGIEDQPGFLNQVVAIRTSLSPEDLLSKLLDIEAQMGRVRKQKWGERLIDLDILYYLDEVIDEPDLQIPHPGIPDRRFTLVPLVEIAGSEVHPILKKSQQDLLRDCSDPLEVQCCC